MTRGSTSARVEAEARLPHVGVSVGAEVGKTPL
jgi:hypothetical protein